MARFPRWAATDEAAPPRPFHDRFEAGRVLATRLAAYANRSDAIVLGLPRGGVAVAYEVARALNLPLDVFIVRKLGVPGQEELAMGAIATGGVRVLNQAMIRALGLDQADVDEVIRREEQELRRREQQFRGQRPPPDLKGKIVILVDDGLATGATMWAAITAVQQRQPAKVVMAVPVADPSTCDAFRQIADDVVCAITAEPLHAVGLWYQDFPQMTDEEVRALLQSPSPASGISPSPSADKSPSTPSGISPSPLRTNLPPPLPGFHPPPLAGEGRVGARQADMAATLDDRPVRVRAGTVELQGNIRIPPTAGGIVVFAHGSGSGRHSPRNRFVADVLVNAGLATLLIDLLTEDEEMIDLQTAELRFDIRLLAERLGGVTDWLAGEPSVAGLSIGYFGASTGAAAALIAAADRSESVRAIVSRGGRPDLAEPVLPRVAQPTLLIVGGEDDLVIDLNRQALRELGGIKRLVIIPRATHLFEEPGALEQVAALATEWFRRYLGLSPSPSRGGHGGGSGGDLSSDLDR